MEKYDIAIIGTGPAGLEAAITAKLRNKSVLLLGSKTLSTKVEKAHTIKNYLGLPDTTGEEMQHIKWNFTKFLVNRSGNVVDRFEPTADFDVIDEQIKKYI